MSFSIGNSLKAPFQLPQLSIPQKIAEVSAPILKLVAGTAFEGGKLALGAAAMVMPFASPLLALGHGFLNNMEGMTFGAVDQMTSAITGRPVPFSPYQAQLYTPTMWQRAAMPGGFAGAMTPNIYNQIGAPYGINPQAMTGSVLSNNAGATMSMNPWGTMSTNAAATGAQATINAGMMPTGDTGFDLANSISHMPTYSPAEQSLLNQIQDPQQRAMQELQMFMQKQALLATTLSNIANMRHEMMKTVANNLRA